MWLNLTEPAPLFLMVQELNTCGDANRDRPRSQVQAGAPTVLGLRCHQVVIAAREVKATGAGPNARHRVLTTCTVSKIDQGRDRQRCAS